MGYGWEATRQTTTGWTLPKTIIQAPNSASSHLSPDLAVDSNGSAVAVVSIFDATINVDRASVWVSRGTPDGTWTKQQRITDPTVPVDAYATRAMVSPDGLFAAVGWVDHDHGVVQVSKWTGSAWGKATNIGELTTYSKERSS